MTVVSRNLRTDQGASAVEYGLIAVAIAALIAGIVFTLGQNVFGTYETTCEEVSNGAGDC
jgi:pilus assembly protein Flp/PilA